MVMVRRPTHAFSRARKQEGRRLRQERRVPLPRHHHRQVRRRHHGLHLGRRRELLRRAVVARVPAGVRVRRLGAAPVDVAVAVVAGAPGGRPSGLDEVLEDGHEEEHGDEDGGGGGAE